MKKHLKIYFAMILLSFTVTSCTMPSVQSSSSAASVQSLVTDQSSESISRPDPSPSNAFQQETIPETRPVIHDPADFVDMKDYIPSAIVDLKYATADNFTGSVIYNFTNAYLRYGTVLKLLDVQKQLEQLGYRIKIWDAFRPFEAQVTLWNVYPDGNFVADPKKGYTSHNLGNTVDLTLTRLNGDEIPMPTEFDDFTAKADRNYADVSAEQAANSKLLEKIMTECGFKGYVNEWWHYEDTVTYAPDTNFLPPANNTNLLK